MEQQVKLSQPRGLWILSFTAIWERFSYYGMRAFLYLYMYNQVFDPTNEHAFRGGLSMDKGTAGIILGIFAGACYFLSLPGGMLADRYLGKRKSVIIGGILITIGHFTLAADYNLFSFYTGLALLALGNGFFKPNCSSMIGDLYQQGDKRRDSGFTIFYTLFNGGAGVAPILCGYFGETYGYKYGFYIAGFAMLLGLIVYIFTANKFLGDIGKYPTYNRSKLIKTEKKPLTKEEKDRVIVIWVMLIFVTFFFFGFEQAATTFNYYTDSFINKSLFGFELKTTFFQSINPFLILIFGSSFAAIWVALAKKGKNPSSIKKMGLGMITLALGFIFMLGVVIQRGGDSPDTTIKASMWWIIAIYVFHTIGELFLSPIGLSLVTKLAPEKNASLFMGLWFACIGLANIIAGFVVGFVVKFGAMNVFATIAIVIFIMGTIVLLLSNKLLAMMHGRD